MDSNYIIFNRVHERCNEGNQTRFFICFAVAISATMGVAFSANLLTLYIFYELLSVSTYSLVGHHQNDEAKAGARKYLIYLFGGSIGLVLPAMIIIYQITGTLDFNIRELFQIISNSKNVTRIIINVSLWIWQSWTYAFACLATWCNGSAHSCKLFITRCCSCKRVFSVLFE